MRDLKLEDTIYILFTTRAFATGIPTTLANTPVLSIYEENNLTQITAGVSVTADYDSVTGLNQATIVATAANGYEAGKSYDLVITTGTVDSVSVVGEVVGSFTVQSAPVNWARVTAPTTANDLSATDIQLVDTVTTYTGNTVQTGDAFGRLGAPAGASVSADLVVIDNFVDGIETAVITNAAGVDVAADIIALKAETALIVADTNELQTDNVPGLIATAQADLDILTGADGVNLLTATQASIDAIETDTSTTLQAELDAIQAAVITNAAGTDIAADIIAVKAETALIVADTNELQTDDVPTLIATAQTDLDTISDGIITGTAATGTLSTTQCTSNLTGYTDDQLIGRIITFLAGPADGESSDITAYANASGLITFTALSLAPQNGNAFKVT